MKSSHSEKKMTKANSIQSQQVSVKNTIGLENHVTSVFSQTQTTICTLNQELDKLRKYNEELTWKLQDLTTQKEKLSNRNENLSNDLSQAKSETNQLLKTKNDLKQQLSNLKSELNHINNDWEHQKKGLLHEINLLNQSQRQIVEERNKEALAFQNASNNIDIEETTHDIKNYENLIDGLKNKESISMNNIYNETSKFKEFLEDQKEKMSTLI